MSEGSTMYVRDERPPRGAWAPGHYQCWCSRCGITFTGDKRAMRCADCAYAEPEEAPAPAAPQPQPTEMVERVAYQSDIIRLAYRTYTDAKERGDDHGDAFALAISAVIALLGPHFRNEGREEAALIAERHAVEWPSRYHEDAGQDMAVACTKVAAAIRASKEPT